jgi:hypothetical protein
MRKALVAVGVDKAGTGFPPLSAAASGAKQIADWGKKQGFDVTLVSDSGRTKVKVADVYDAVDKVVKARVYSQLVLYFSGHGVLQAPDCEVWLLSGAPDNPNESINVNGSIIRARSSGIEHVVVISDACRSLPPTLTVGSLSPGTLFSPKKPKPPLPEVDVFYATLPGDPAYEVNPTKAVKSYRGLLTQCMIEALTGKVPAVIRDLVESGKTRHVVPSRPLKIHVEDEVPNAAAKISIKLEQDPDVRVESDLPKYLAEIGGLRVSAGASPPSPAARAPAPPVSPAASAPFAPEPKSRRDSPRFKNSVKRILDAKGRVSFETRTGFTVHGAAVAEARVTGTECDVFEEAGAFQIRVHEEYESYLRRRTLSQPRAALIQFQNRNGIMLAVIPGYVGTVVVEDEHVVTVNYTPARGSANYPQYERHSQEVEERRAMIAVAARNGSFRPSRDEARQYAETLRDLKRLDPTLGLYASYAYAQVGDWEGVLSVSRYMLQAYVRRRVPVPFDVVMLAAQYAPGVISLSGFPPQMPMLTQGWTLLGSLENKLPRAVQRAKQFLLPSLWSTFSPKGVEILRAAMPRMCRTPYKLFPVKTLKETDVLLKGWHKKPVKQEQEV